MFFNRSASTRSLHSSSAIMSIDPLCVAYSSSQEHRRLPMNLVTFDIDELPAIGSTDHDGSFDRQSFLDETSGGTTTQTWIVYDGNSNTPYAQFNGSGTLLERYLAGPSYVPGVTGMVARTNASGVTDWYLTGKLGSVRDIVNTSGTVIDHIAYDAFGGIHSESDPSSGSRFKFEQMIWDNTIENYYDNARYYDQSSGKFISSDSMCFNGGDTNLYRYIKNSSINSVDPSGHFAGILVAAGVGFKTGIGIEIGHHGFNPNSWNWGTVGASTAVGAFAGFVCWIPAIWPYIIMNAPASAELAAAFWSCGIGAVSYPGWNTLWQAPLIGIFAGILARKGDAPEQIPASPPVNHSPIQPSRPANGQPSDSKPVDHPIDTPKDPKGPSGPRVPTGNPILDTTDAIFDPINRFLGWA